MAERSDDLAFRHHACEVLMLVHHHQNTDLHVGHDLGGGGDTGGDRDSGNVVALALQKVVYLDALDSFAAIPAVAFFPEKSQLYFLP